MIIDKNNKLTTQEYKKLYAEFMNYSTCEKVIMHCNILCWTFYLLFELFLKMIIIPVWITYIFASFLIVFGIYVVIIKGRYKVKTEPTFRRLRWHAILEWRCMSYALKPNEKDIEKFPLLAFLSFISYKSFYIVFITMVLYNIFYNT